MLGTLFLGVIFNTIFPETTHNYTYYNTLRSQASAGPAVMSKMR